MVHCVIVPNPMEGVAVSTFPSKLLGIVDIDMIVIVVVADDDDCPLIRY